MESSTSKRTEFCHFLAAFRFSSPAAQPWPSWDPFTTQDSDTGHSYVNQRGHGLPKNDSFSR